MSPTTPLYSGTPVVNNDFLRLVRQGAADYQRGETTLLHHDGLEYNFRTRHQSKDERGETRFMSADMIVLATGFERPTIDFLPKDLFPPGYARPNMYLQCFPVTDASVVCTNATYVNGIGSVGTLASTSAFSRYFCTDRRRGRAPRVCASGSTRCDTPSDTARAVRSSSLRTVSCSCGSSCAC